MRIVPLCITLLASAASVAASMATQHTPYCRTASDTSAVAVSVVLDIFSRVDSISLIEMGLPFKPAQGSIVTNEETCQSVIAGYNIRLVGPDTTSRIRSGYVVAAGNAYGLFLPGSMADGRAEQVSAFTSTFEHRFSMVLLQ